MKERKPPTSKQMFLIAFIIIIFFLIISAGYGILQFRSIKKAHLLNNIYYEYFGRYKEELNDTLKESINLALFFSRRHHIIEFCNSDIRESKATETFLREINRTYSLMPFLIREPNLELFTGQGFAYRLDENETAFQKYSEIRESKQKLNFYVYKSSNFESEILWITAQIYDRRRFLGVFGVGHDIRQLLDTIIPSDKKNFKVPLPDEAFEIYLIERNGNILYNSGIPQKHNNITNHLKLHASFVERIPHNTATKVYSSDKNPQYMFISRFDSPYMQTLDWYLIGTVNRKYLLKYKGYEHYLIVFVIITVFITALILVFKKINKKIADPIIRLSETAGKIADNEFDVEFPDYASRYINEIGNSLKKIRNNIKAYHNKLDELIDARTDELQFALIQLEKREALKLQEIRFASSIQSGIMPSPVIWHKISLLPYVKQMEEIGGDLIDIIEKDDFIAAYVADISGHGIPASLVSMLTKIITIYSIQQHKNIEDIVFAVNSKISSLMTKQKIKYINYFTMFFVLLHKNNSFDYLCAGHIPAVHFHKKSATCELISTSSSMIGVFNSQIVKFNYSSSKLEKGDKLVIFSDGFVNAKNFSGRKYGLERVMETIKHNSDKKGEEFQSALLDDFYRFKQDCPREDDMSVLIIEPTD